MTDLPVVVDECWSRIGVWGDQSCAELKQWIHCRNCPVFARAARAFFDRPPPEGYLADWTALLAGDQETVAESCLSVLLFRLDQEILALPTALFAEVSLPRPVHRVPHRTNKVFVGIVNVRGRLHLCASLRGVLGLGDEAPIRIREVTTTDSNVFSDPRRLLVVDQRGERWAFHADEVKGVERIPRSDLGRLPGTLANPAGSCSRSVFTWHERRQDGSTRSWQVGLLDEERVLAAFRSLGA